MFVNQGRNISKTKKKALLLFIIAVMAVLLLALSSCAQQVTLYFAGYTETDGFLVSEERTVSFAGDDYQKIIEELIKGPGDTGLFPTIPSDVKVNSVMLSGGTAIVDLSKEVLTNFEEIPHSSLSEELAIYSIVNTLTGFEGIDKVRIIVEGLGSGELEGLYIEDFWGHIGIYTEFERNEEIIQK